MKGWLKGLIIGLFVSYILSFLLAGLDTKGWSNCGFLVPQKCTAFDVIILGPILAMAVLSYIIIPIIILSIIIGHKKLHNVKFLGKRKNE